MGRLNRPVSGWLVDKQGARLLKTEEHPLRQLARFKADVDETLPIRRSSAAITSRSDPTCTSCTRQ